MSIYLFRRRYYCCARIATANGRRREARRSPHACPRRPVHFRHAPTRDDASARLQLWFDLVRRTLVEVDLDSMMITMTGHVRDVLGIDAPAGAMPLEALLRRIHPDDLVLVRNRMAPMPTSDDVFDTELRVICSDGCVHWIDWRDTRLVDDSGRLVKIVAAGRDVTARRERAARVAERSGLLRTVLGNLPVSIYTQDCEGRYVLEGNSKWRMTSDEWQMTEDELTMT